MIHFQSCDSRNEHKVAMMDDRFSCLAQHDVQDQYTHRLETPIIVSKRYCAVRTLEVIISILALGPRYDICCKGAGSNPRRFKG